MRKIILFCIVIFLFNGIVSAQLKLEISIKGTGSLNKFVRGAPMIMTISWENTSQKEIRVGVPNHPSDSSAIVLWINGQLRVIPQLENEEWWGAPSTLKPAERKENKVDLKLLQLSDGTYKMKAIADFSRLPQYAYKATYESNMVEFSIEAPQGIDLQAYEAASKYLIERFKNSKSDKWYGAAMSNTLRDPDFILKAYPNSTYAAWSLWYTIYDPPFYENEKLQVCTPEQVVLIKLGKYPLEETKKRKNVQTSGCSWIINRYKSQMDQLIAILEDGEPRESLAECLAEEYFFKQIDKSLKLFKMSKNNCRGHAFIDAIRKYMPEYAKVLEN